MEEVDGQFARLYGVPDGVFVTEVAADSPAEEVGILSGDVLVEFDGEEITSIQQLQNKLEYYKIGQTVSVVVKRLQNGVYEDVTFTITLGRRTE